MTAMNSALPQNGALRVRHLGDLDPIEAPGRIEEGEGAGVAEQRLCELLQELHEHRGACHGFVANSADGARRNPHVLGPDEDALHVHAALLFSASAIYLL